MTNRTALVLLVSTFALAACGAPAPAIDPPSDASESNAEATDGTTKASGDGFDSDAEDKAPAADKKKTDSKDTKGDGEAEPIPAGDDDDDAQPTPAPKATCSGDIDEVESNNTLGTAMKLPETGRLCATLSSSTDVDVYTLTASRVTLQFAKESGANIGVSIKGPNSQSNTNGNGTISFGNGTVQTYTIEVRGDRAAVYGFDIQAE